MVDRDSLAIVVVSRRHPDRLPALIESVRRIDPPRSVCVVNLTGAALPTGDYSLTEGASTLSVGQAVSAALRGSAANRIWILRDDVTVTPEALVALASVLDASPSVGVVGPKIMDGNSPSVIREMGESMTRSGYSVPLAERELDQAQYDRVSDVLAVGEVGMLLRRDVWDAVGGFDDALTSVDAALDFCCRARLAGWRVEVVPSARIEAVDSEWTAFAGQVKHSRFVREQARARAHRLLVSVSGLVAPIRGIALMGEALARGVGRFVRKLEAPFAELSGTIRGVFGGSRISRARRTLRRLRTQPSIDPRLYVDRRELARRRSLARDEQRARAEAADETTRLRFGVAAVWWTALLSVVGLVLSGPLLGAEALSGGGTLPLPASIGDVWDAWGATWSDVAGGTPTLPDGFISLLVTLASVTWWNPNLAVVSLYVLAVPLAFVSGYVGSGAVTRDPRVALIVGAAWALIPTLHIAVSDGRLTAILAHLALPLAVRAFFGRSIVSLGATSILVAILWASTPSLAPVIAVAVGLRAISGFPAILLTLAPSLALEWPRLADSITAPLTYFADRGFPSPTVSPTGLAVLGLWPTTPEIPFVPEQWTTVITIALSATAALLLVVGIAVSASERLGALALIGGVALGVIAVVSGIPLASAIGQPVSVFTGPLLDVVWFALLCGSALAVTRLRKVSTVLGPLTVVVVGAFGVVPITSVMAGGAALAPTTVRTLPAYVEAETVIKPGGSTIVLRPTDAGLVVRVERDSGVSLLDWAGSASTRSSPTESERAAGTIAANLVVESDFDVVTATTELGVTFVLLEAPETAPEVSAISSHAGLVEVGMTDRGILWRVVPSPTTAVTDRDPDLMYRLISGAVFAVALVAAIPTSLPRRRRSDDALVIAEDDDERA